ncbi:DUF5674 family protein [Nostoc sp. CHAB 5715]|uniref:DUF5674 family protein n=1 Tax=Nostoc sp. CHAB 5715 TaxID=2780400 RepID=UPI001E5468BE|nr:DUF5674 family protein [Nostoc sp. CHAB 5715]MCC5623146.1 DUF5674 family protein [Nostoc sp. CHAB 5715]
MILLIRDGCANVFDERATKEQLDKMLKAWGVFIKLAVDIDREILGGGSQLHYECEEVLLKDGR